MSSAVLPVAPRSEAAAQSKDGARERALRLLLAACALHDAEKRLRKLQAAFQDPTTWAEVVALAESHGLIPILYRNLSACAGLIPEEALRELQVRYECHARQSLRLTQMLQVILAHLESCEIEALPYKGPVLAELLYGDVSLRQFSDLDILVRPRDVMRTKGALESLGFTPSLSLTNAQQKAYLHSGYEYAFDREGGKSLVELQWRILPRFYAVDFDSGHFFAESRRLMLAGRQVRTQGLEDLLLALCVHAAKHAWERLAWTHDVATLIESQAIDWGEVQSRAAHFGIVRIVGMTMVLARDLFGAALPPEMENRLSADRSIPLLAAMIRQNIFGLVEHDTESVPYFRLMLQLRERRRDRLRFLARLIFTPSTSEWSTIQLPGSLFPLYRLVRLWRLLRRLLFPQPVKS